MGHKHIAHIWSKPPKSFLGPTMLLVLKAFSGSPTFQLSTLFTIACCFYIWSDSHSCDLCLTPGASKTWINMKPTLLLGKRIQNMWTSLRVCQQQILKKCGIISSTVHRRVNWNSFFGGQCRDTIGALLSGAPALSGELMGRENRSVHTQQKRPHPPAQPARPGSSSVIWREEWKPLVNQKSI